MYPCPSCGGSLRFDIAQQMLKCEHCDSVFDPAEYDKSRVSKESPVFEAAVFMCPTCGGEMITADEAINGFCPYCGGQSYVAHQGELEKPSYIIPFKVTKEACKDSYRKMTFRALFSPRELRDADALEEFRGIYMPYWFMEQSGHGPITARGSRTYRRGDYKMTDHYDISAVADFHICDTAYEASSSYDDKISDAIAPYDGKDIREFTPGYLTGFYADKADVPDSVFVNDAVDHTTKLITGALKKSGIEANEVNDSQIRNDVLHEAAGIHRKSWSALLPVWFLTWRNENRVAYAVVNGQTGDVCADLPVDMKRYAVFCLLLAIPLYIVLNIFFTPTPFTALRITSFAAAITMIIYNAQLNSIMKRDTALGSEMAARAKGKKQARKKDSRGCVTTIIMVLAIFVGPALFGVLFDGDSPFAIASFGGYLFGYELMKSIWLDIIVAVMAFLPFIGILRKKAYFQNEHIVLPGIAGLASIAICIGIFRWDPAEDMIFYGAVILAYAFMLLTLIGLLRRYNLLATRPLPQTLRQGGDISAPKPKGNSGGGKAAAATMLALFLLGSAVLAGASLAKDAGSKGAVSANVSIPNGIFRFAQNDRALALRNNASSVGDYTVGKISVATAKVLPKALTATAGYGYITKKTENGLVYEGTEKTKDGETYRFVLDDRENLLSSFERASLMEDMRPLASYGNVLFVTANGEGKSPGDFARELYKEQFGTADGVIFLIDMGNRMLWITGSGTLSKTLTNSIADAITDNIYHDAMYGRYYNCARDAFEQIYTVLSSGRILMPMKYISNAFLAIVIATLIAYWVLRIISGRSFAKKGKILVSVDANVQLAEVICMKTSTTKTYDPIRSSGGGGGGGRSGGGFSGGGGGGGGGSFSGGGHRF